MLNSQQDSSLVAGSDVIGLAAHEPIDTKERTRLQVLDAARKVGESVLGLNAVVADRAVGPWLPNYQALAKCGLLGLTLPEEWGGMNASGAVQREYNEILASYCGVTTFVQAQHHGPSRMILSCPNDSLKRRLLPELATGSMLCAVSFAHLRRPGPPVLTASLVEGGVRLNGIAPWVTGWGIMNQVVFGATLPDGRFIYVWVPARRRDFPELFSVISDESDTGTLSASEPLALCAMNASATVEISLNGLFVPEAHILQETDRATMQQNDRKGVLGATPMPLGCTTSSIRVLYQEAETRGLEAAQKAARSFESEWKDVRSQVEYWNDHTEDEHFFENAVRVRAWCIELAVRAAHAAVTVSSGSANNLTHPAQRLLREAMFYTIQAQTRDVLEATLERLKR